MGSRSTRTNFRRPTFWDFIAEALGPFPKALNPNFLILGSLWSGPRISVQGSMMDRDIHDLPMQEPPGDPPGSEFPKGEQAQLQRGVWFDEGDLF